MISTQTVIAISNVAALIANTAQVAGAAPAVPKMLQLFSQVLMHSAPALDELIKLRALLKQMINESREPTEDEWLSLQTRSDIAHEQIQAVGLEGDLNMDHQDINERLAVTHVGRFIQDDPDEGDKLSDDKT